MSLADTIVVLDDDQTRRESITQLLRFAEFNVRAEGFVDWFQHEDAQDLSAARLLLMGNSRLPVALGRMLSDWLPQQPDLAVVLLEQWSESGSLSAEQQRHILGTIADPFTLSALTDFLHQAQAMQSSPAANALKCTEIVGQSAAISNVKRLITTVAERDSRVLITGESGTGKEMVAKGLHDCSNRADGPFVPLNCGAIPAELLESELFGHEKGSFTGAVSSRAGRFELAKGGTLFLDEIGDMPLHMQVKLLRVLQENKFERVGGSQTIEADVRVITATHKNLEQMIEQGEFREDLYYRLNVFPIEMPPLRERVEDLPLLLDELIKRLQQQGLDPIRFHPAALESLKLHGWPGNVRELANLVERMAIMQPNGVIGVSELPSKFRHIDEPNPERYSGPSDDVVASAPPEGERSLVGELNQLPEDGIDLKAHLEEIEQALIEQSLDMESGVVSRAAAKLQIRRTTLVEKMRKYGINRK